MKSRQAKKIIMAWGRGEIEWQRNRTVSNAFAKTPLAIRSAIMWLRAYCQPMPTYEQLRRFRPNRFWLSWYQPTDDYRPLTDPPAPGILGWWCTRCREPDRGYLLVALVDSGCEEDAKTLIQASWPEATEWRFCDPRPNDWCPTDRFPLSDWMRERLGIQPMSKTDHPVYDRWLRNGRECRVKGTQQFSGLEMLVVGMKPEPGHDEETEYRWPGGSWLCDGTSSEFDLMPLDYLSRAIHRKQSTH